MIEELEIESSEGTKSEEEEAAYRALRGGIEGRELPPFWLERHAARAFRDSPRNFTRYFGARCCL